MGNTATFIASLIFGLLTSLFWLRVIFQWKQVSFINPVSQMVYRCTQPLVGTLQMVLPKSRLNWAAIFITFAIQLGYFFVLYALVSGISPSTPGFWPLLSVKALFGSIDILLEVFFFMLLFYIIGSWMPQVMQSPLGNVVWTICHPVAERINQVIPPVPPLSFGVLILMLMIHIAKVLLLDLEAGVLAAVIG